MYNLRHFHGPRFERVNAIIDSLSGHVTSYVNLIGSATLPLPEVCRVGTLPATACRVEGHIDSRLFPATEPMDRAEALVEEETRRLFGLDEEYAVSAQPHSATQANHVVFRAVLNEEDGPVAGWAPADGGHISHRFGVLSPNKFVPLPISAAGIDYDVFGNVVSSVRPAIIVAGGSSFTRSVDYLRLRGIADLVGAHLHADLAHTGPFVATGLHPPAFPHVDSATIDMSKNLRGAGGGILVYRRRDEARVRRAIFPIVQSSPNQNGLLAKAACMTSWSIEDLSDYALNMIHIARVMGGRIARMLGEPVFGGTDTHLLLFDVSACCGDGREAEVMLERSRILVNRNQLPCDARSPWAPSGIRLSSTVPAILGYTDEDAQALGDAICSVLSNGDGHRDTIERLLEAYHRPIVNISSGPT